MNTQRTFTLLSFLLLLNTLTLAQTTNPPRLGVNTTTPEYTLDVNGAINIHPDSAYRIDGQAVLRTQKIDFADSIYTSIYLGPGAGQSNTTGAANHFIGYQAGQSNTTGAANHFIGYQAGQNNTRGSYNHFSGHLAGQNNTRGSYNHFIGYWAGYSNTTGKYNHFSGHTAGANTTTGSQNYFSGHAAGYSNGTGSYNHFSGFEAGIFNTTGSQNVYIGYKAGFSGNYTNSIAIGYEAESRGNNTVTIGNSSMTSIGGYQPWSNLSDGRFKREVTEDVPGLEFVTRLRPVSYRIDRQALQQFLHGEEVDTKTTTQEQPRETGFIAQEVEEVAKSIGYEFNGIIRPQGDKDHYQLSYATFVVPLVQAVQEQQELIEALQAENARLSQENALQQTQLDQLNSLQNRLQTLENLLNLPTEATASNR